MITAQDPTRTIVLRRIFVAQMKSRFKYLDKLIKESLVKNNAFGYEVDKEDISLQFKNPPPPPTWKSGMYPIAPERFKFNTDPEKITLFMEWLNDMERKSLFQIVTFPTVGEGIYPGWTNVYIGDAYQKGILWARSQMLGTKGLLASLGLKASDLLVDGGSIVDAFNSPVHADRVGILYTRTFNDLKGITDAMDTEISRILSSGLISGASPASMAKEISEKIGTIGIHRATLLARTEVIRAHHLASIQEYRNAGVVGVEVEAEWHTARDSRVCSICAPLDYNVTGKVWSLDEIEGKIPVHPQCRCAALPHLPDLDSDE